MEDLMAPQKPTENSSFMGSVFRSFQGRHTTAVAFFSIVGTIFHWFHRLDSTYITFITVMMGFVLGHSIKEDYFQK